LELEVLDLSKNVLARVPGEIFYLPLLRSLYLERNNFNSHAFEGIPNPIQAPLKKLNLADNNLNYIPKEFGILPELRHLNISSNWMQQLSPQQFSPFCNLKEVDMNNTLMNKCLCVDVVEFLTFNRNMSISPLFCKTRAEGKFFKIKLLLGIVLEIRPPSSKFT
jgi:Leucine-rich repeat (LRR) protein